MEENLKNKGALSTAQVGAPGRVTVTGMGAHIKWRFDDRGAIVNGLKHPDAEAAGIRVGMRLTSIGDQSMAGMERQQIQSLWHSLQGARATLTLEAEGSNDVPAPAPTPAAAPGFGFGGGGFGGNPLPRRMARPAPAQGLGVAPGFGAAPAFVAAPAFGAPGFGAFGAPGLAVAGAGGGFGFGQAQTTNAQPPPNPKVVDEAPALVKSAELCYHNPDGKGVYSSSQCRLTQGKWYFELQHVHIKNGKVGVAVWRTQEPALTWIADARPWKDDATIGVAIDCESRTAQLVINHVWGQPTAIPCESASILDARRNPLPPKSSAGFTTTRLLFVFFLRSIGGISPVLTGQGACTMCLSKSQAAHESRSLPFGALSEALAKPLGASRLVRALLDAKASPMGRHAESPIALHMAVQSQDVLSVRYIGAKANLNITDAISGRAALHLATAKGLLSSDVGEFPWVM